MDTAKSVSSFYPCFSINYMLHYNTKCLTKRHWSLPFFVSGGILEVQPHLITILADRAMRAKDIDEVAAKEAKQRAEEAIKNRASQQEFVKAQIDLVEAVKQLETLERWRKNR